MILKCFDKLVEYPVASVVGSNRQSVSNRVNDPVLSLGLGCQRVLLPPGRQLSVEGLYALPDCLLGLVGRPSPFLEVRREAAGC